MSWSDNWNKNEYSRDTWGNEPTKRQFDDESASGDEETQEASSKKKDQLESEPNLKDKKKTLFQE